MGFLDIYIMLAGAPWGAAPIDDIRREGGGGSRNAAELRTNSIAFADKEAGGIKKSHRYVDVIYGSPLRISPMTKTLLFNVAGSCDRAKRKVEYSIDMAQRSEHTPRHVVSIFA